MALKERIPFGVSLPRRSPDAPDMAEVRHVAQRAEALGFRDLWVTENTFDHVHCFDPVVVLAAYHPVMVAHPWATLDYISGGCATLGQRRPRHPGGRSGAGASPPRVRGSPKRAASTAADGRRAPRRRAPIMADGWMGSGGPSIAEFGGSVPILKPALAKAGRDPEAFPISKRVVLAVEDKPEVARAALHRWFSEVYHNPEGTEASGVYGTPAQMRDKLEALIALGANHLLLNPISRYAEQLVAVAEVVGLSAPVRR